MIFGWLGSLPLNRLILKKSRQKGGSREGMAGLQVFRTRAIENISGGGVDVASVHEARAALIANLTSAFSIRTRLSEGIDAMTMPCDHHSTDINVELRRHDLARSSA